jgi:hypothetical protein
MDDGATKDVQDVREILCPTCSGKMEQGWVSFWNPFGFQKVRWKPTKPRYVRMSVPEDSFVLLEARLYPHSPRVGMRCPECAPQSCHLMPAMNEHQARGSANVRSTL